MRFHFWDYTVYISPTKMTPGLNELLAKLHQTATILFIFVVLNYDASLACRHPLYRRVPFETNEWKHNHPNMQQKVAVIRCAMVRKTQYMMERGIQSLMEHMRSSAMARAMERGRERMTCSVRNWC